MFKKYYEKLTDHGKPSFFLDFLYGLIPFSLVFVLLFVIGVTIAIFPFIAIIIIGGLILSLIFFLASLVGEGIREELYYKKKRKERNNRDWDDV